MHRTSQTSEYVDTPASVRVLNFGIGQPSPALLPTGLMQRACRSLEDRLPKDPDRELLSYGEGQGYLSFRVSLAKFLSRQYGTAVAAEELLVTSGNSTSMLLVATMPTTKEVLIYTEDPTYFLSHAVFQRARCSIRGFPVDNDGLRVDLVAEALDEADRKGLPKPQLLYTIPTFQNPTGTCLSAERRRLLVQLAVKHNFLIVADEPYNMLYYDGVQRPSLYDEDKGRGRVLSLGTFSKILGPGLRLGWAQGTPALIAQLRDHGMIVSAGGLNPLVSAMVHPLLDDGSLERYIVQLRKGLGNRMQVMLKELKSGLPSSVSVFEPQGGYFVWVRVPGNVDVSKWEGAANNKVKEEKQGEIIDPNELTEERKVFFTPGSRCSELGTASPSASCIRLSIAMYEPDEIRQGMRALCGIVKSNLTAKL